MTKPLMPSPVANYYGQIFCIEARKRVTKIEDDKLRRKSILRTPNT